MDPCAPSCTTGSCAADERCVSSTLVYSLAALCLKVCTLTGDCPPGMHCVQLPLEVSPNGRYCIGDTTPPWCGADALHICDTFVPPACAGSIATVPYDPRSNVVCGPEHIDCRDAGCSDGIGCN
jgi:hypothetical protein